MPTSKNNHHSILLAWLAAYYKLSLRIDTSSVISFGMIFYALSIFLNRANSNGVFSRIEDFTKVQAEVFAMIITIAVVVLILRINLTLSIVSALVLISISILMWYVVTIYGFAWQQTILFSVCLLKIIKNSGEEVIAKMLEIENAV